MEHSRVDQLDQTTKLGRVYRLKWVVFISGSVDAVDCAVDVIVYCYCCCCDNSEVHFDIGKRFVVAAATPDTFHTLSFQALSLPQVSSLSFWSLHVALCLSLLVFILSLFIQFLYYLLSVAHRFFSVTTNLVYVCTCLPLCISIYISFCIF